MVLGRVVLLHVLLVLALSALLALIRRHTAGLVSLVSLAPRAGKQVERQNKMMFMYTHLDCMFV